MPAFGKQGRLIIEDYDSSEDDGSGIECDHGGQDMGGGSGSVARRARLPGIHEFCDGCPTDSSLATTSSSEEDRLEFESRQARKFGGRKPQDDRAAVDTDNIISGKRKRASCHKRVCEACEASQEACTQCT